MSQMRATPVSAFYRTQDSAENLLAICDAVCSRDFPIFGSTFACDEHLDRAIRLLATGRAHLRGFRVSPGPVYRIEVPISRSNPSKGIAKGHLWQSEHDSLINFVASKDDFPVLMREIQRYLLNDLTLVYLQTEGFRRCFDSIVKSEKVQSLSITDYTVWVMADDSTLAETRRVWPPEPLDYLAFFEKLLEEDQRIRSLGINAATDVAVHGRIRRDLTYSCDTGFRAFFDRVMGELRSLAAETRRIFLKRGADESPTKTPRPLRIAYSTPIFEDKKQNHRLIRVLGSLPDSALSVFHPNPYVHASIVDYADGSSYTLWVTENNSIEIVPEIKASAGSLERLCNHIAEVFGEGVVEDIPA